jgi:hypothetical protein
VGFAVLAAVDVALQVHQEQPPHRRPPPLLPHPFQEQSNPTPPLDGYSRGRAKEPLQSRSPAPRNPRLPFVDRSGPGQRSCLLRAVRAAVSARQQTSGEMGKRAMAWAGGRLGPPRVRGGVIRARRERSAWWLVRALGGVASVRVNTALGSGCVIYRGRHDSTAAFTKSIRP